jgi:hypothetical protein
MILKKNAKDFLRYYKDSLAGKGLEIKYFNCQIGGELCAELINNSWFVQFITNKNLNPQHKKISIFSVNGSRLSVFLNRSDIKLFYTFENVHVYLSPWRLYEDLMLKDKRINLSIGFDYLDNYKYIRFPYWITTMLQPTDSLNSIQNIINSIEGNKNSINREKFSAFICRLDYFGDRAKFADLVAQINPINFPGNFRHNDDSLQKNYNDDKIEYLKQFKFNLCPENSDNNGYVTEKIFDAIKAGCIPIYWGSENNPEPEILNQSRILFLKLDEDNTDVINKIKFLNENPQAYQEFVNQTVFQPNAAEHIYGFFERLEIKLKEILH